MKRAEELLREFESEADAALVRANNAVGDAAIDGALAEAGEAYWRAYSFGHALCQVTGRNTLQAAWNFQARLNKFLRRRWVGVKHGVIAPAPLPDEAVEILEALKATMPPSRIFEGEAEYRAMLQAKGSVEIDDNDYVSQTTPRPTQSWD